MNAFNESSGGHRNLPFRAELEQRLQAKIVTFEHEGQVLPGGACRCCGCGPNTEPDFRGDPWYIYVSNICDTDGVFYAMLCEGCLEEIRHENSKRPATDRDLMAKEISELLDGDIDGTQSMMDDLEGFEFD